MDIFEYVTEYHTWFPDDKHLNKRGQKGWELVSTLYIQSTGAILLTFKRKVKK